MSNSHAQQAEHGTPAEAQALQELYRDIIAAYIASAPAPYRESLRHLQQRIDDASLLDEDEVRAFEVLSKLFKDLAPRLDSTNGSHA